MGVLLAINDLKVSIRGVASVLRSFRVFRMLGIIKRSTKSIQMIFNTFVLSITPLSNIGALLLLIIYTYTILGMILIGQVKRNGIMDDYLNFESF